MAIGWKGETRGRRVDKGVKGLLSHSRHSKRTWCGLQFAMESSEEARGSAKRDEQPVGDHTGRHYKFATGNT